MYSFVGTLCCIHLCLSHFYANTHSNSSSLGYFNPLHIVVSFTMYLLKKGFRTLVTMFYSLFHPTWDLTICPLKDQASWLAHHWVTATLFRSWPTLYYIFWIFFPLVLFPLLLSFWSILKKKESVLCFGVGIWREGAFVSLSWPHAVLSLTLLRECMLHHPFSFITSMWINNY